MRIKCPQLTAQEEPAGLSVRSDALEQRERIADAVAGCGGQLRRVQKWVDGDDLLEKRRHDTCTISEHVGGTVN